MAAGTCLYRLIELLAIPLCHGWALYGPYSFMPYIVMAISLCQVIISRADSNRVVYFRANAGLLLSHHYNTLTQSITNILISTFTTITIIIITLITSNFDYSYRYMPQILPSLIVAPMYFRHEIELGAISQSYGAFNHVLGDFSIIINSFEQLSAFRYVRS